MPPRASLIFGAETRALLEDRPDLVAGINHIERRAAEYVQQYCVASDFPGRTTLGASEDSLLLTLTTELASLEMTYGRRLAHVYADTIDAIARQRLHLAALALRAYIELVGALRYFEGRIGNYLTRGIASQVQLDEVLNLFRIATRGGRFPWEEFLLGTAAVDDLMVRYAEAKSVDKEPASAQRQKSVATFVAEADAEIGRWSPRHKGLVKMTYALLSDTCHPSMGGDLWFADVPQVDGRVGRSRYAE